MNAIIKLCGLNMTECFNDYAAVKKL